jgi:secreted PhoX family phosphatase
MSVQSSRPAAPTSLGRRNFLRGTALAAGAAAFGSFEALAARTAGAAPVLKGTSVDYGPLFAARDQATGLELLRLPRGFEYMSFSWTGDELGDGTPTPSLHDGQAAFRQGDLVAVGRNHEQGGFTGKFTDPAYDPMADGGTTTLIFDPRRGRLVDSWASISGTIRNCAGGLTPWQSWLTCEETTVTNPVSGVKHGYIFDVPVDGRATGVALTAMGRFSHEAVAVDPDTGWVYETEDSNPSGLYRFKPNRFGDLEAGGTLEMLVINGNGSYDTRRDGTGTHYDTTSWVTIDTPDPNPGQPSTVQQGIAQGGAVFNRLEGIWHGNGNLYIVSTSGGPTGQGQIFEYRISDGAMRVLFASPSADVLNNPDNITVSPRGGLMVCEDGSGTEFLHGLTPDGQIFQFAANNVVVPPGGIPGKPRIAPGDYRGSEFAGATFEPRNGNWLFVNIQTPGITFAITGPWRNGTL